MIPSTEIQVGTREAAQVLGVSRRTVQRRAKAGTIPAAKDERGHYVITLTIPAKYTDAQIAKAMELIEQDGIQATDLPGIYVSIGSDGDTMYPTTLHTCGCKAGQNGRNCYHRLAAAILTSIRQLTAATPLRSAA